MTENQKRPETTKADADAHAWRLEQASALLREQGFLYLNLTVPSGFDQPSACSSARCPRP